MCVFLDEWEEVRGHSSAGRTYSGTLLHGACLLTGRFRPLDIRLKPGVSFKHVTPTPLSISAQPQSIYYTLTTTTGIDRNTDRKTIYSETRQYELFNEVINKTVSQS